MDGLVEIVEGRVQVDRHLEAARPAVTAARWDLAGDPAVTASGAWLQDKRYAVAVDTAGSRAGPLGGHDRPGDPGGRRPARAGSGPQADGVGTALETGRQSCDVLELLC